MRKSPAFQIYPGEFISDFDVQNMNMEEIGVYIYLLFADWLEDGIPDDLTVVEGWLKHRCTTLDSIVKPWSKFTLLKNGKRYNPRLNEEREKQLEWRQKSSEGGKKSAATRRESKGGTTTLAPHNHSLSSLSSLSSVSDSKEIPEKKKKDIAPAYLYFARTFLEVQELAFPKESAWKDFDKRVQEGGKNLELFTTKEKWTDQEIDDLLDWILTDSFWSRQIRTLGDIRKRKNGVGTPMKFENARASMISGHEETLEEQIKRVRNAT